MKTISTYRILILLVFFISSLAGISQVQGDHGIVYIPEGGFYKDSILVQLSCEHGTIYYTTDGSTPGKKSRIYSGPIKLNKSTVIRSIAYSNGRRLDLSTQSYLINEPPTDLLVVSLAISPSILFNPKYGLFMPGPNPGKSNWKLPGANFWKKTEALCNVEMFEPSGEAVCNQLSGFRMFGGMSRIFPQKSIALAAREKYGEKRFDYPVFGKNAPKKFKFLVLRNSGSDFGKSHFRDALITSMVKDWDIDIQDYRPSHVYINGKYWGIYNIREKINRYYLASHHGYNKDSIDLLEHKNLVKFGTARHYGAMIRFIKTHDFKSDFNLQTLDRMMDIDNFMNYQIAEIYCDNQDSGGNIKYWKPHGRNGRWRWILFDTDFGFGLHNPDAYRMNTLFLLTDAYGPSWPNPPWSTLIIRKLLRNKAFREKFITRFCDHLNDSFSPKKANAAIDKIYNNIVNEIPRHLKRWELNQKDWEDQVDIIRTFANERPDYMRVFLADMFKPGKQCILNVESSIGGKVILNNTITINDQGFDGKYFTSLKANLHAFPEFGYLFDHWEGPGINSKEKTIQIGLGEPVNRIRAVFIPHIHPLVNKVIINEISNANSRSGDWIELFNTTDKEIQLNNWIITDNKHEFHIPAISIGPKEYLVICQDLRKFKKVFKYIPNAIGSFRFGLSKVKENVSLFADDLAMVDKVKYEFTPGDSLRSMALINASLDNEDSENWEHTLGIGSPGKDNRLTVQSSIEPEQKHYVNLGLVIGIFMILGIALYWKWYIKS